MTTASTSPLLPTTDLIEAKLDTFDAEASRHQIADAAHNFREHMPDPRAIGGLLMLYGGALASQYSFEDMTGMFGIDTLAFLADAYTLARMRWDDTPDMHTARPGLAADLLAADLLAADLLPQADHHATR